MLYTPVVQRVFFLIYPSMLFLPKAAAFHTKNPSAAKSIPRTIITVFGKIPLTFPLSGMPAAESTTPMIVNSIMPMP